MFQGITGGRGGERSQLQRKHTRAKETEHLLAAICAKQENVWLLLSSAGVMVAVGTSNGSHSVIPGQFLVLWLSLLRVPPAQSRDAGGPAPLRQNIQTCV